MPVTVTYPGVYVQEVPSGVRTIVGVSTSVTMFLGMAKKGPINKPIRCLNYTDFVRTFSDDTTVGSLPFYVKLFFLNGGTDCYVMRIANGPAQSAVTLLNESAKVATAKQVLVLKAKDAGTSGDMIRAWVTYDGQFPEAYFTLRLFRWEPDSTGKLVKTGEEIWRDLSMNPTSPLYAPDFVTQNSNLVDATLPGPLPAPTNGFSLSGRVVVCTSAAQFLANWKVLLGNFAGVTTNMFQISVGGSPFLTVDLSTITVSNEATLAVDIQNAIKTAFNTAGIPMGILGMPTTVDFSAAPFPAMKRLRITANLASPFGDVFIRPAMQNDLAVPLMLGTAQGGIEVSGYAGLRPAASGISFRASDLTALNGFGNVQQQNVKTVKLESLNTNGTTNVETVNLSLITSGATDTMFTDKLLSSPNGNSDGIREKFGIIAQTINTYVSPVAGATFPWTAAVWGSRLAILPAMAPDNFVSGIFATAPDTTISDNSTDNVHYYQLGIGGTAGYQTGGAAGNDGNPPLASDYDAAYLIIDKEVDLFNLMVLPPDAKVAMRLIYPNASVFCQRRRAFLLMDAPPTWADVQTASTDVANLRVGLVKDYSAIFYPNITVDDRGKAVYAGPTGAIAGVYARIDGTRGVWKAPAGTEADLRGILGLQYRFSDPENGVLNPRAINTIRVFPNGIVNWGARTMDGDDNFGSEYKYVPVRRLALFIEESLYRGLKWVVFEPNDEPLWAQIRLNVGAFMHDLFRQGAFQGQTTKDAYFVKCDGETTTQTDRNLGIVNIWVGFAPLKPAEFVVLYLQQMAGQIQV